MPHDSRPHIAVSLYPLLVQLIDSLPLDFFTDARFNPFVFFFGNLLTDLSVGRIPEEDVCVEDGRHRQRNGDNLSKEIAISPRHGRHEEVVQKAPKGIKQKPKVDCNHDTKEFELRLQATDEQSTAGGVDRQDPGGYSRDPCHHPDLIEQKARARKVRRGMSGVAYVESVPSVL